MSTGHNVCTTAVARPGGKRGPITHSTSTLTREI
jgi:hypothetical protein